MSESAQSFAEAIAALITFLFSMISFPQTATYQRPVDQEPVVVVIEEPSPQTGPWVCVNEETGASVIFGGSAPLDAPSLVCYLEDPNE